jgi:hypothetical protein
MMLRRFSVVPLLLIVVGLAAALGALALRYRVEARTRATALVLDYAQLRSLAVTTGRSDENLLRRFRDAGITGVALTEESLAELESDGVVDVTMTPVAGGREYVVEARDPVTALRISEFARRYLRAVTEQPIQGDHVSLPGFGGGRLYVPGRWDDMRSLPVGLDETLLRQVREAGLEPVGRIQNPLGLTEESLRWSLRRLREAGVRVVIFAGEEVLGYRGLVEKTAAAMRELGLHYGSVEFGKQRGDDGLSRLMADQLVRVHSISAAEMPRLTPQEAIERYVRAMVERNIRLDYVRLPGTVTTHTLDDSVEYVKKLSKQIAAAGFVSGTPHGFSPVWPDPQAGRIAVAAMALGVGGAAALLLAALVPLPHPAQSRLGLLLGLGCAAVALTPLSISLSLVALLAAIVFPTLGFVLAALPVGAFVEERDAPRKSGLGGVVVQFLLISAITLVGAVMVAGLLSELPYMIKIRSFAGIKAATVVPLLMIGWIYLTGISDSYKDWQEERDAVVERLRRFFDEPLRVWHTIAFGVALVTLALVVARSGNDSGVGVSELELKFRVLLDRLLGVRPRTKEFMIGHPALLLGLFMAAIPQWRRWALPVLLVGVIGQVGMINSFCHLHSPLLLTVLRTFHGLWAGLLIGLVVVLVAKTVANRTLNTNRRTRA